MNHGLICKNVTKPVGSFLLQDISFELPKGYVLGVIGRNGSGKTTLLRCLMGLYSSDGSVVMDGRSLQADVKGFKKKMAYVSSEVLYDEFLIAKEIGERYGRYYEGFDHAKYLSYLTEFDVNPKSPLGRLSQGQKIRVSLAFALSYDASLYIFDEPTGNLDVEFRDAFYKQMRKLMESGEKSIVFASHLMEELEEISDYILWLQTEENPAEKKTIGRMKIFAAADQLRDTYRMVEGPAGIEKVFPEEALVGATRSLTHNEWLIRAGKELPLWEEKVQAMGGQVRFADLKEIMYYEEKGGDQT